MAFNFTVEEILEYPATRENIDLFVNSVDLSVVGSCIQNQCDLNENNTIAEQLLICYSCSGNVSFSLLNITPPIVNQTNLVVDGYVEADDFVVHSDGFRNLSKTELKNIINNLDNLQDGSIDKSKVPDYYKTEDGEGIRIWRLLIDVFVNFARQTYSDINDLTNKLDWIDDNGYVGSCINTTYVRGVAVGCDD